MRARRAARAALRHSLRGQGQYRRRRLPTTCACPAFAYVPERSATVVERLEAAGAILIGKTNLDQFATGPERHALALWHSDEPIRPRLHFRRIELGLGGGRRGGSRLALRSAPTPRARAASRPRSTTSSGLKPTKGIISTRGVVPACRSQDAVSIFALTVGDAAKVAETAIAFDEDDSFRAAQTRRHSPSSSARRPLESRRSERRRSRSSAIGEYRGSITQAIDRLAGLGAEIVPIRLRAVREDGSHAL